jgi:hypothetical protein
LIDEEEESLLQDSMATPERDEKHEILVEQKQRMKFKTMEAKMVKEQAERKKEENMLRLKEL